MRKHFQEVADDELKVECINYFSDGTSSTEPNVKHPKLVAKQVKYLSTGNIAFYVKRYGGEFYDTTHVSYIYDRSNWKMAPVTQTAFELYLQFLGFREPYCKGKLIYKKKAERLT